MHRGVTTVGLVTSAGSFLTVTQEMSVAVTQHTPKKAEDVQSIAVDDDESGQSSANGRLLWLTLVVVVDCVAANVVVIGVEVVVVAMEQSTVLQIVVEVSPSSKVQLVPPLAELCYCNAFPVNRQQFVQKLKAPTRTTETANVRILVPPSHVAVHKPHEAHSPTQSYR